MGKYTPLNSGGYARVHLTNYKGIECIRKVLKDELICNKKEFDRFLREYRILKEINHPNVIKVFEVEGGSYIMEKADCDLEDYIKENTLVEKEIDSIIDGIISGVQYLHSKGIIHRDLKPGNILMIDGIPKISDLGICKPLYSSTILTTDVDEGLGTLPYMSQAQQNRNCEPVYHFDIFAIGRIIYFLETQKSPPIGRFGTIGDLRYKALVLATESDTPILVPTIEKMIELRKRIFEVNHSPTTAIDEFIQGKIGITEMVIAVERSTRHDNFELVNDNMIDIISKIKPGDDHTISLIFDLYIKEFFKYQKQSFWPYTRCNDVTDNLLQLHELCNSDELKRKLFVEAFRWSYKFNQWGAIEIMDRFVKNKGINFYLDCCSNIAIERFDQKILDYFIERNG